MITDEGLPANPEALLHALGASLAVSEEHLKVYLEFDSEALLHALGASVAVSEEHLKVYLEFDPESSRRYSHPPSNHYLACVFALLTVSKFPLVLVFFWCCLAGQHVLQTYSFVFV